MASHSSCCDEFYLHQQQRRNEQQEEGMTNVDEGSYYYYNAVVGANTYQNTWFDSDEGVNLYFAIFLSLLVTVLVCAKFLLDSPRISCILPEAGMTVILGTIAGAILFFRMPVSSTTMNGDQGAYDGFYDDDHNANGSLENHVHQFVAEGLLSFSPKIFFYVLSPPIIFNSGYTLQREVFFRHIAPISLFACAGTVISALTVAILLQIVKSLGGFGNNFEPKFTELMVFGALISATDPVSTLAVFQAKQVDPQLFYLVFGESVLNDAVGLVLFKTTSKLVGNEDRLDRVLVAIFHFVADFSIGFVGSLLMGLAAGLVVALFLKIVDMRHTPLLEMGLFFLVMYIPFFVAELMELPGIVTIFFTGISARRYATHNLSELTEETVDHLFRLVAHLAETAIFLELGLCVVPICHEFSSNWQFALWAMVACLMGRALNVYPLQSLYNQFLRKGDNNRHSHHDAFDPRSSAKPENGAQHCDNMNHVKARGLSSDRMDYHSSDVMTLTPATLMDLKIRDNTAHMLWFAGLRGAVAYACAKTFPNVFGNRSIIVFTTMAIVLFTVFVFGSTTELALNLFQIEMGVDEEKYMEDNETLVKMDYINSFEAKYIYPLIIRNYNGSNRGMVELDDMSMVGKQNINGGGSTWNPSTTGGGQHENSCHGQHSDSRLQHAAHQLSDNPATTHSLDNRPGMARSRSRKMSLYDFGQSVRLSQRQALNPPTPMRLRYTARERFLSDTSLT